MCQLAVCQNCDSYLAGTTSVAMPSIISPDAYSYVSLSDPLDNVRSSLAQLDA